MYARLLYGIAVAGIAAAVPLGAQTTGQIFQLGYTDIGPVVGIGGIGGAGLSFGGRFERAIKTLPNLGDGTLGIEGSVDYWSYNDRFINIDYGFRYIAFGGTANYHFKVKTNPKVDPFLGLGLGFNSVSSDYVSASSGVYFIGRAGIRYFYKPKLALYADAGAGASTLNFGLMFKLSGK
jgi:hypothetical protein